ncbi:hypothetical protein, partial [Amycolatopsis sp.]|uniref:hypothetical protein n=1 Tax=Amycolatopsis sp. TaxID=37632 RepID=UPI002D7F83D1
MTLLVAIAATSVLVGLGDLTPGIPATRVVLLGAGLAVVGAGLAGLRRIDDRTGVPVLPDLLRALRRPGDQSPSPPPRGRTTPSPRGG